MDNRYRDISENMQSDTDVGIWKTQKIPEFSETYHWTIEKNRFENYWKNSFYYHRTN